MGLRRLCLVLGCLLWLGCGEGVASMMEPESGAELSTSSLPSAASFDEASALRLIQARNSNGAFQSLVRTPYKSSLSGWIDVMVTKASAARYLQLTPETHTPNLKLPVGTLIIREVRDESMNVTKVTVMGQGPAGYNPAVGDFWFAVTDAAGNVLVENGVRQAGTMPACQGCHIARKDNSFLFGVPNASR